MQTIFPVLRYKDARGAIRWLCEAFGFSKYFRYPTTGRLSGTRSCGSARTSSCSGQSEATMA